MVYGCCLRLLGSSCIDHGCCLDAAACNYSPQVPDITPRKEDTCKKWNIPTVDFGTRGINPLLPYPNAPLRAWSFQRLQGPGQIKTLQNVCKCVHQHHRAIIVNQAFREPRGVSLDSQENLPLAQMTMPIVDSAFAFPPSLNKQKGWPLSNTYMFSRT
jgi:hypothetical protein